MARVLMAWELGANYGHLAHQMPVASLLRDAGHEVLFAVRDTSVAAEVLAPAQLRHVQAPRCLRPVRLVSPIVNYAELLLGEGYGMPSVLLGQLAAWLNLMRLHGTDLVLADHSPTAILAARIAQVPVIAFGSGFSIPPDQAPLPSLRPWLKVPDARHARSEAAVVAAINTALRQLGGRCELARLSDAYAVEARLLATFAQLDHYGERRGGEYTGPIFGGVPARRVDWERTAGRRILAYLRNGTPGLGALMKALATSDAEVICAVPAISPSQAGRASTRQVRVIPGAVDLDHLLADADLTICTAGVSTTSQSMLSGVPLLLLPNNADQALLSMRARDVGVALVAGRQRDEAYFRGALEALCGNPAYRESARKFASAHAGYRPGDAVARVAAAAERAISNGSLH